MRIRRVPSPAVPLLMAGLAFCLYAWTAAPSLTWANYGADGGDFLAAAMVNGAPHPTGYPLYTLLLQGWLALFGWLAPGADLAWRGNLFSGLAAAVSVGVTAYAAQGLAPSGLPRPWAGLLSGLGWAVAPLLWGQALITEVYALHAVLFTTLGSLLLAARWPTRPRLLALGLALGLGMAHHLTILLLVPALFYWLLTDPERPRVNSGGYPARDWLLLGLGALPGLLLYARLPLAAAAAPPPPVNWGYPVDLGGLWWLVSGAAYRRYLFAVPGDELLGRMAWWAQTLTSQYTPLGFGLALAGLYRWDRTAARLRNFALLWMGPTSLYMAAYNTTDSVVYLLPVVWMLALLLPHGLVEIAGWLHERIRRDVPAPGLVGVTILALLLLTGYRVPQYTLRQDQEAVAFLEGAIQALEPNSLLFSSGDRETFALWYGAWATGDLLEAAPGTVLVNVALLQFDWYRELLARLYPDLPGVETGAAASILAANVGKRPIFFSEQIPPARTDRLMPVGSIWRLQAEDKGE